MFTYVLTFGTFRRAKESPLDQAACQRRNSTLKSTEQKSLQVSVPKISNPDWATNRWIVIFSFARSQSVAQTGRSESCNCSLIGRVGQEKLPTMDWANVFWRWPVSCVDSRQTFPLTWKLFQFKLTLCTNLRRVISPTHIYVPTYIHTYSVFQRRKVKGGFGSFSVFRKTLILTIF